MRKALSKAGRRQKVSTTFCSVAFSAQQLSSGGNARRRLRGQGQPEPIEQDFLIDLRLSVAGQDQGAPVCGGEMHVEHL